MPPDSVSPPPPATLAADIRAARRRGDVLAALDQAQEAAKIHRRSIPVLLELAETQRALGQIDDAAATYRAILAFSPSSGNALAGLGRLAEDADNLPEAEAYFREALIHRTNDPKLRFAAGHLQLVLGHVLAASETLDPFLAPGSAPDSLRLPALADLLRAALACGQTAKARATATGVIGLNPAHTEALAALGQIAAQRGNAAAAHRWWRRALGTNPRSRELRRAHASSLIALGRLTEAEKLLRTLTDNAPGDALSQAELDRTLLALDGASQS